MMYFILFILIYTFVLCPLVELYVDWLEYKFQADIYIKSRATNFREYRKYKQLLFGRIKKDDRHS